MSQSEEISEIFYSVVDKIRTMESDVSSGSISSTEEKIYSDFISFLKDVRDCLETAVDEEPEEDSDESEEIKDEYGEESLEEEPIDEDY